MFRLSLILFLFVGSTLAGAGVVAALALGFYEPRAIGLSAAVGALLAVPVSMMISRRLLRG